MTCEPTKSSEIERVEVMSRIEEVGMLVSWQVYCMVCGNVGCEAVYVLYLEVCRVRNLLAYTDRLQARWSLSPRDVARRWSPFRANRNGGGMSLRNVRVVFQDYTVSQPRSHNLKNHIRESF
jgi:hypothetical protein